VSGYAAADLQGAELLTVDEYEVAVVESDSPPPGGVHNPIRTDFDGVSRTFSEVLDDYAALLLVRAWKNDDRAIHFERMTCRFATLVIDSFGHISPLSTRPPAF
jgi:hypothetical protein